MYNANCAAAFVYEISNSFTCMQHKPKKLGCMHFSMSLDQCIMLIVQLCLYMECEILSHARNTSQEIGMHALQHEPGSMYNTNRAAAFVYGI